MLDYEIFKRVVAERIKDFLPPVFQSCTVTVTAIRKINEKKDTLLVMPEEKENIAAMPNIYLDDMYEEFLREQDLDEILRLIAALILHYTGSFKADQFDLDFKGRKDSIVMNLINTQRNQELLEAIPHKEIMDLSIIYRIIMNRQPEGMATVLVDYHILEELEMEQEELEQLAYANTGRMFPP